jgi:hypothetical protein
VTDKKLVNVITGNVMKAIAGDVRDIWKLFAIKLAPLADQGTAYEGTTASDADIKSLLKFFDDKHKEVCDTCP